MINRDQYRALLKHEDWDSIHALLDEAREKAITPDDRGQEVFLRVATLKRQERYAEALHLVRDKGHLYNSNALAKHDMARVLVKMGREQDALDVLRDRPYEAEMTSFPVLAMDAKFFHAALLAKSGDPSAKDRLAEIPDDYLHVTMDGDLMTKSDIVSS